MTRTCRVGIRAWLESMLVCAENAEWKGAASHSREQCKGVDERNERGHRFGADQMGGLCLEWMEVIACLVNAQCGIVWRALRSRE